MFVAFARAVAREASARTRRDGAVVLLRAVASSGAAHASKASGGSSSASSGSAQQPRVNEQISARTVRLVRELSEGEVAGSGNASTSHEVVSIERALTLARRAGLDLVEVNGTQTPPVCRLMDYERVRYDQRKRAKEQKKATMQAQKRDVIKELRLTAKIDTHDLETKLSGAKKFLEAGNRVTFRIEFKNSDGIAPDKRAVKGAEIMQKVLSMLQDIEVVLAPKMVGTNHMTASVKRSMKSTKS